MCIILYIVNSYNTFSSFYIIVCIIFIYKNLFLYNLKIYLHSRLTYFGFLLMKKNYNENFGIFSILLHNIYI